MDWPQLPTEPPSSKTLVRATTLLILLVVLASGPLVPWVDFTQADDSDYYGAGPGSAEVTVTELPADDFRIGPARFGAGVYLYSAPATVHIDYVAGSPRLIYELRIAGLGYNGLSVTFLDEEDAGTTQTLQIERSEVDPDSVTQDAYAGELEIRVRGDEGTHVVYERNVTVTVENLDED